MYEDALRSLPNLEPPMEFQDYKVLTAELKHESLLEELVFWTVKYEFPEGVVCLLLKLLPDVEYKGALTRSFVRHYSRYVNGARYSKENMRWVPQVYYSMFAIIGQTHVC